ncbi:MAG: MBL fold metallo-hydrolase [Treponema sp.]|nr:MBL fold metallo-hydrolase [Treponema sp.]
MKITVLGSGTSHGIPVIACECPVCKSKSKFDNRLRSSILVQDEDENILVDCGPEFRIQALRCNLKKLDTILLTHSHADHLHGIDDLRVFACLSAFKKTEAKPLEVYGNTDTLKDFKYRFAYLFMPVHQGGGRAMVTLKNTAKITSTKPLIKGKILIYKVPMYHGTLKTNGYIFKKGNVVIAYLTDCNRIPKSSIEFIKSFGNINHLIIDGLREKHHSTHFSFSESLEIADIIAAKHTWLTHICHEKKHKDIQKWIDSHITNYPALLKIIKKGGTVCPAYDGLILE